MTKIIAIANQKGGVGKTTTAINLSTAFAAIGKNSLLLDLDPQGNSSTGMGITYDKRQKTVYDVLTSNTHVEDIILSTKIPRLDILPSTTDLAAAEVELISVEMKEMLLKTQLEKIKAKYDYIIIDCAPSLGQLTINALAASGSVLMPLQCEFFALEGLAHLLSTISLVKKTLNPNLKIEGILLTMLDKRNKLCLQVENDVRKNFNDLVYKTTIPRNVRLPEASSHEKPALLYDSRCSGSIAYMLLAKEILNKHITV